MNELKTNRVKSRDNLGLSSNNILSVRILHFEAISASLIILKKDYSHESIEA